MRYEDLLKKYLAEYKIVDVVKADGFVKVGIVPRKDLWGVCTFVFTGHHILCCGDVQSYSWNCTWDTAARILEGNCYASQFDYLQGKWEHSHELKEFDFSYEVMDKIKKDIIDSSDFDEDGLIEFKRRWIDNYFLLGDVEGRRLGGLDEFFEILGVDDAYEYYGRFERLPDHYLCAVAMLRCIEDHFRKEAGK